jgi:hypothetical protein
VSGSRVPGTDVHEVIQAHRRQVVERMQEWTRVKEEPAEFDLPLALVIDSELTCLGPVARWLDLAEEHVRHAARRARAPLVGRGVPASLRIPHTAYRILPQPASRRPDLSSTTSFWVAHDQVKSTKEEMMLRTELRALSEHLKLVQRAGSFIIRQIWRPIIEDAMSNKTVTESWSGGDGRDGTACCAVA